MSKKDKPPKIPQLDELDKKVKECFPRKVVRKYYASSMPEFGNFPIYVSEYLISKYATDDGTVEDDAKEEILNELKKFTMEKRDKEAFKSMAMELGSIELVDHYDVWADLKRGKYYTFIQPLDQKASVDPKLIRPTKYQDLLKGGLWGKGRFQYIQYGDGAVLNMSDFESYQTKGVIISKYNKNRQGFTGVEWINFLIRSIGFDPHQFNRRQKMLYLARMIPIVEQSTNSLELGPPGTGKSYVYENLSEYSRMLLGGEISAAKLIYNQITHQVGYVFSRDLLCFDEINKKNQSLDPIVSKLQQIMASNRVERGDLEAMTPVSLVFQGNIDFKITANNEVVPKEADYLKVLPPKMYDTAFLDRIHMFLHGWEFPRVLNEYINRNLGLISNYFGQILHKLRTKDVSSVIENRLDFFQLDRDGKTRGISIRDKIALHHIISGYIKLLYPDKQITDPELVEIVDLAIEFRQNIINEIIKIDPSMDHTLGYNFVGKTVVAQDEEVLPIKEIESLEKEQNVILEEYVGEIGIISSKIYINTAQQFVKPIPYWLLRILVQNDAIQVKDNYFLIRKSKLNGLDSLLIEIEEKPIRTGTKTNSYKVLSKMDKLMDEIEHLLHDLSSKISKYHNCLDRVNVLKVKMGRVLSDKTIKELFQKVEEEEKTLSVSSLVLIRNISELIENELNLIVQSRGLKPDLLSENYASIMFDANLYQKVINQRAEQWAKFITECATKFSPISKQALPIVRKFQNENKKQGHLFNGEKFSYFSVDVNNIATSTKKRMEEIKKKLTSPLFILKDRYLQSEPYYIDMFASKHLERLRDYLPESDMVFWHIENYKKNSRTGQYVDVDATLTGTTVAFIEQNHKQIKDFYLFSGDKDLHIVVDTAKKYNIPVTVVVVTERNLSYELMKLADRYESLY